MSLAAWVWVAGGLYVAFTLWACVRDIRRARVEAARRVAAARARQAR